MGGALRPRHYPLRDVVTWGSDVESDKVRCEYPGKSRRELLISADRSSVLRLLTLDEIIINITIRVAWVLKIRKI